MRSHAKASTAGSTSSQAPGLGRILRGAFATRGASLGTKGSGAPSMRRTSIVAFLALALLAAALAPSTASAAKILAPTPFSPITGSGTGVTIHLPSGIAVDEASGNVFLNDGFGGNVTDVFGAEGGAPTGVASPYQISGFNFGFEPSGVAVDNSATSPSKGAVYVTDVENFAVKKLVRNPISELYEPAAGEEAELIPSAGPGFVYPLGAAVDSHGNVFVADWGSSSVVEFSPTGTQLARLDTSASVGEPSSIALDSAGDLFVQGYEKGRKVVKYPVNGSGEVEASNFSLIASEGTGVAVDSATNTLYVAFPKYVNLYDASTLSFKGQFGFGVLGEATRIAVNSNTGRIYVSDNGFDKKNIAVFALLPFPDVFSGEATAVTTQAATLNGTVNPSGAPLAECFFEYLSDAAFKENVKEKDPAFTGAAVVPCAESPASIGEGESPVKVHADITGLTLGTAYRFRLVAKNANGTVEGSDKEFKSAGPPEIHGESVHPHDTSARLEAKIYPGHQSTEYQFEYVDQAGFEAEGFLGATTTPVPAGSIPAGGKDVEVAQPIVGLAPATTYHFRVIATNPSGSPTGDDKTFTTHLASSPFGPCPNDALRAGPNGAAPSLKLPDCRAYEQASPVHKNGSNVQSFLSSFAASVNGDAVSFESATGIPGGEGSQEFPTYLASRGAGGWSTQGLLPPASAGPGAAVLGWTPDFSQVFDAVDKPGAGGAFLSRSSASGSLTPIVPYMNPPLSYSYAGASADGSKVLFGANGQIPLPPGSPIPAAGKLTLYAWDRDAGEARLAGVLPDGSAPPEGSQAGQINESYARDNHATSSGGSVYFTDKGTGQLYLRQNPTAPETTQKDIHGNCVPDPTLACTIHVSASEKKNGGGLDGHDAAGVRPAAFMTAAPDGSAAFFTSSEKLTNDATTGPEPPAPAIARANVGDGSGKELGFLPVTASGIAVGGEYVYWADPDEGTIGRAKLNGSEGATDIKDKFITGLGTPQWVAVDGEYVYWTDPGEGKAGEGTIGRAKLDGSGTPELSFITGASEPQGVAVNATHVFWANDGTHAIARAGIEGDNPELAWRFLGSYPGDISEVPQGVAVNATHVYWTTNKPSGFVSRIDLAGSKEEFVFIGGGTLKLRGIALDANHVYWVALGEEAIGRVDLSDFKTTPCEEMASCKKAFIPATEKSQGLALDASHLYWSANAEHLPNAGNDLYRYDANAPAGERLVDLVPDTADEDGIEVQGVLGTSDDGSYLYYVANGVPDGSVANSPNANGESAAAGNCHGPLNNMLGICNLYLWQEDGSSQVTTFIARLDVSGPIAGDVMNWIPSIDSFGGASRQVQKTARVSADGRTLLFRSKRKLTAYDNEGRPELYRYRAGEAGATCVSCNPTGAPPPERSAELGSFQPPVGGAGRPALVLSRNLSADGNRVFFETTDALVAADVNGDAGCRPWGAAFQEHNISSCQDVYEWEASGTGSCHSQAQNGGCLYLLTTGKSPEPSFFADASASGDDAFIFTFSQLVGQDQDELLDVYDVRAGGGLAAQSAVPPVPCEGEACRGGEKPLPPGRSPGTASFTAPGNQKPVHKKAKKKHKRRHHAKKRHHKRQHRNANTTRRASR